MNKTPRAIDGTTRALVYRGCNRSMSYVTRLSSSRDSVTPLTDSLIEELSHLKTQVMLVSYLSHNPELGFNVQIYS